MHQELVGRRLDWSNAWGIMNFDQEKDHVFAARVKGEFHYESADFVENISFTVEACVAMNENGLACFNFLQNGLNRIEVLSRYVFNLLATFRFFKVVFLWIPESSAIFLANR